MQILYLPLDERPCNLKYPQMIAQLQPILHLAVPPREHLGRKKQPANVDNLTSWLREQAAQAEVAIVSLEMLVYGGLLPSRLHHEGVDTLLARLDTLRHLKTQHPHLTIFASNLIMRTPAYSSSEEEPDYYAQWGEQIFQWGWLTDKGQRETLTPTEQDRFDQITHTLPPEYLQDYRDRRTTNLVINQAAIALVKSGVIDFLAIPQDDCARYGFTALDQQAITQQIRRNRLQNQIHLYPGADEVGCTLLARAYHQLQTQPTRIYCLYSSVCSEQIVPLYEDRPIGESVKAHILAAGGTMVQTAQEADIILAINTPGQVMQESWDQERKDITYDSYRNLRFFVEQIGQLLRSGNKVAIADVAFANGGETELVQLLDDAQQWESVTAYGAWNTSCNTIGTVISTAILSTTSPNQHALFHNKIYRLLEDWLYQAIVRQVIIQDYLPTMNASYYDFNDQEANISQVTVQEILKIFQTVLPHSFENLKIDHLEINFPWQRMFEVDLSLEIQPTIAT